MELLVFPGAQCWAYFLCAWPVCCGWQAVQRRSEYRVRPATVGQGLGRTGPKPDCICLRPCPTSKFSWGESKPALTTLPKTGENKEWRKHITGRNCAIFGIYWLLSSPLLHLIYQLIGGLNLALIQSFTVILRPCTLGDFWLLVLMLTVALCVISVDLDPVLDYDEVKNHFEKLPPHAPPNSSWWVVRTLATAHSHTHTHHISF